MYISSYGRHQKAVVKMRLEKSKVDFNSDSAAEMILQVYKHGFIDVLDTVTSKYQRYCLTTFPSSNRK